MSTTRLISRGRPTFPPSPRRRRRNKTKAAAHRNALTSMKFCGEGQQFPYLTAPRSKHYKARTIAQKGVHSRTDPAGEDNCPPTRPGAKGTKAEAAAHGKAHGGRNRSPTIQRGRNNQAEAVAHNGSPNILRDRHTKAEARVHVNKTDLAGGVNWTRMFTVPKYRFRNTGPEVPVPETRSRKMAPRSRSRNPGPEIPVPKF
jgi:hypothetical protein